MLTLVALGAAAQAVRLQSDLASLIAAERAFARTSAVQGTRDAFLAYLAEDAVIFRPFPVNGRKWMTEHPDQAGLLTWRPAFADISRSGNFGYTTGPWEFRKDRTERKPQRTGSFVSIWKRQADGKWKVALDTGIAYPQTGVPPRAPEPASTRPGARASARVDPAAEREALLELDRAFARETAQRGAAAAFADHLADTGRLLRNNYFPLTAGREIRAYLATQTGTMSWRPTDGEVSNAGDLGYTYGVAEYLPPDGDGTTEYSNYLHIWKRQANGRWRVVLDVATPTPPPAAKP